VVHNINDTLGECFAENKGGFTRELSLRVERANGQCYPEILPQVLLPCPRIYVWGKELRRITFLMLIPTLLLISVTALGFNVSSTKKPRFSTLDTSDVAERAVLFEDDFEGYDSGRFPYAGWDLWFDGVGDAYQVVVDNVSRSGTKSLQLLGVSGWAAFAAKPLVTNASKLGFEVYVRVEETRGETSDNARVSFTKWKSPSISMEIAPVCFLDNGKIVSDGQILQSYDAEKWYKVALLLDRPIDTYSVWIDDVLRGENLPAGTTSSPEMTPVSYEIEAFSVSQCYNTVKVYFDDVKVFGEGSMTLLQIKDVSTDPVAPNVGEDVAVSAIITDADNVDQALLAYALDTTWNNVSMNWFGEVFNATIPSQPFGVLVQYRIYASDVNGNWIVSSIHSYTVSDFTPPEIVAVSWTPAQPSANDTVRIDANITNGISGGGISRVLFSFTDSFGQLWTAEMKYDYVSGLWTVIVPRQPGGTVVQFHVVACDNVGNQTSKECEYNVLP